MVHQWRRCCPAIVLIVFKFSGFLFANRKRPERKPPPFWVTFGPLLWLIKWTAWRCSRSGTWLRIILRAIRIRVRFEIHRPNKIYEYLLFTTQYILRNDRTLINLHGSILKLRPWFPREDYTCYRRWYHSNKQQVIIHVQVNASWYNVIVLRY